MECFLYQQMFASHSIQNCTTIMRKSGWRTFENVKAYSHLASVVLWFHLPLSMEFTIEIYWSNLVALPKKRWRRCFAWINSDSWAFESVTTIQYFDLTGGQEMGSVYVYGTIDTKQEVRSKYQPSGTFTPSVGECNWLVQCISTVAYCFTMSKLAVCN